MNIDYIKFRKVPIMGKCMALFSPKAMHFSGVDRMFYAHMFSDNLWHQDYARPQTASVMAHCK